MGQAGVIFILKHIAGTTGPGAERAAPLDHEAVDEPMENSAVIVGRVFHQVALRGVDPIPGSRCEPNEVGHGSRCFVVMQQDPEGSKPTPPLGDSNICMDLR